MNECEQTGKRHWKSDQLNERLLRELRQRLKKGKSRPSKEEVTLC